MSPFDSAVFHTSMLALLLGFGFGAAVSSIFSAPRWLIEELSK